MWSSHQKAVLTAEKDMTESLGILRKGMGNAVVNNNHGAMSPRTSSLRT